MSDNPYDALVSAVPEENPYDSLVGELDSVQAQSDDRIRTAHAQSLTQTPEQTARVLELSRRTGVPQDVVEKRFDDIHRSLMESEFDPVKWRKDFPDLAGLIDKKPELGSTVMRDQHLSVFAKAWNAGLDFSSWLDEKVGQPLEELTAPLRGEQPTTVEQRKADREGMKAKPRSGSFLDDAKAAYGRANRELIPVLRYFEASQQMELSKLQFQLLKARALGDSGATRLEFNRQGQVSGIRHTSIPELEAKIADLKAQSTPRDYQEGEYEQVLSDASSAIASQVAVFEGAGKGAAVAGGAAFAATYLTTRNGAAARAAAMRAASVGGKAGMAWASLQLEAGGAYGELLNAKTDDGRAITEEEARGGALLYGGLAAVVELGSSAQLIKAMGPAGQALLAGERKAAVTQLMKDAGFRQLALKAAKDWAKAAGSEGAEEFTQSLLQDVVAYFTVSKSAGALQKTDGRFDLEANLREGQAGLVGGIAMGAPGAGVNVASEMVVRGRHEVAARQIATIANLAESPTAQAAPEAVAELIAQKSAESGEPVTSLYVDPAAFTRFFQENEADPRTAASELLGEDGAKKLLEARVTGEKVEVPVALFLQKWGASKAAQALAGDIAAAPGLMTANQLKASQADIEKQAAAIADEMEKKEQDGEVLTATEMESRRLVEQLVATGMSKREASIQAAIPDAFARTMLARSPQAAAAVLGEQALSLNVEKGDGKSAPGAIEQPAFHGSPHRGIESFSLQKIGTGEGNQAYGWGMYFAGNRAISEYYREALSKPQRGIEVDGKVVAQDEQPSESRKRLVEELATRLYDYQETSEQALSAAEEGVREELQSAEEDGDAAAISELKANLEWLKQLQAEPKRLSIQGQGQLYGVEVPDAQELLDWDKPLLEQSPSVIKKLDARAKRLGNPTSSDFQREGMKGPTGSAIYSQMERRLGPEGASKELLAAGIPGLQYLDAGSRGDGGQTHNYVIWDESRMPIKETYYQPSKLSATHQSLVSRLSGLSQEQRGRELYIDRVSGLLNRDAWDRLGRQPGKQVAVITTPDVKAVNDDPAGGHDSANVLLRRIGVEVAKADSLAARSGTNYLLHLQNEAQLQSALESIQAALPDGFRIEGAMGSDVDAAFAALDAKVADGRKSKRLAARGKTFADLSRLPELERSMASEPANTQLPRQLLNSVAQLTDQQYADSVYWDKVTPGVLSATGWNAVPRKAFVTSIDLRGLKKVNETLGPKTGDQMLEVFARAAADIGGEAVDFAHLSGDEYACQSDNKQELQQFLDDLRAQLADVGIPATLDGDEIDLHAEFRDGIGEKTYGAADRVLNAKKRAETSDGPGGAGGLPGAKPRSGPEGARSDVQGRADLEARRARSDVRRAQAQVSGSGQEAGRLNQDDYGPRGYTQFSDDGLKRIITIALNKNADRSTFLHESAHVFLELFADIAERPDATEAIKDDWARLLKEFGITSRAELKREHHEQFARSFEAYGWEGKAPSARLAGAFERFKLWLKQVYRTLASLNVQLSDDMRGVFDRMLATDAEIARVSQRAGLQSMFRSPAEAGMSPEQWQTYLREQEQAASHVSQATELRVLKDRLREQESWWKEEEAKELEKALEEYEQLPARRAKQFLRGKSKDAAFAISLDRKAVEELIGKENAKRFGTSKDGTHPDELADIGGFATGKEMLQAILALPEKEAWAEETARERMREKHPELLQEKAKLQELVAKGLHGDFTQKWLLREWDALRKKAGAPVAPVESIKRAAQLIAEKRQVRRLDAGAALRSERAAAEKAAVAAAKGDYAQAAVAKQQQLLNFFLHRELSQARDARDAFEELALAASKDAARARLGKAGRLYRDSVDMLLEAFGLREPEPNREQKLPSIGEVVSQLQADGATVMLDEQALSKLLAQKAGDWKNLTVSELKTLDTAVRNIQGAGRAKSTVLKDGKRVDREAVVAELLFEAQKNLKSLGPLPSSESAKTLAQSVAGGLAGIDGSLLKPELLAEWLGGRDLNSAWFRAIVAPLQEAKHKEADLLKRVAKPVLDAFEAMPKNVRARMMERIDGKALFPTHAVASMQQLEAPTLRYELLMMALNAGNESNLSRLLEGRSITEKQLIDALSLLSKEELDWVQSVWDACESLWPEMADLEERDSGLRPEKIQPRAMKLKAGELRGGYFPAVYDRRVEAAGERQVANSIAELMDPSFTRPGVSHGHLKGRVDGFTGVIALEPGAITSHLSKAVHDLAFREAVKSVGSLVMDADIQAAMKDRLGDGRAKVFLQWLKDIGSMRGTQTHGGPLMRLIRKVKANNVIAVLGYSLPTALGDLSNLVAAVPGSELKAKHWAAGLLEYALHPMRSAVDAEALSGELRFRRDSLTRELGKQVQSLTSKGLFARGPLRWLREYAFSLMEMTDKATSTPIWMGAYRQALAEGKAQTEAVTFADSVIRKLFPSHSAVDLAEVLRDKGFIGTSMMFYGFFSVAYNRNRAILHELHTAEDFTARVKVAPRVAGRLVAFGLATSVVSELLSGRGKDEEEEWEDWMLRKLLTGWAAQVPFGGELASLIEGQLAGKPSNPRASGLVGLGENVVKAVKSAADESKDDDKKFKDALRALGPLMGLPTAQPVRTGGYLWDVAEGDVSPEGPADLASGLIYGQREGQPENLLRLLNGE